MGPTSVRRGRDSATSTANLSVSRVNVGLPTQRRRANAAGEARSTIRYATRRSPTSPGRLGTQTDFGEVRRNQRSYAVQRSGVEVCLGSNPAVSPGDGGCRRSVRGPDPPHGKPSPPPAEGEPPVILSASVGQPSGRWSTRKQQTARTRPRQSPNQSTPTNWPMCARVR